MPDIQGQELGPRFHGDERSWSKTATFPPGRSASSRGRSRWKPSPKCPTDRRCALDRKSPRLNSSHTIISYAVFFFKKKKKKIETEQVKNTLLRYQICRVSVYTQ